LKRRGNGSVLLTVFATGVSAVVVQLVMVREFLAGFEGNEYVISLVLLCWLAAGGLGALAARDLSRRTPGGSLKAFGLIAAAVALIPPVQTSALRYLRSDLFVQGASVGLAETFAFAAAVIAPYAFLVGVAVPFGLFAIRSQGGPYPAARIYAVDTLGAVVGGAAFSLVLVKLLTPFTALLAVDMLLLAAACLLLSGAGMHKALIACLALLTAGVNGAGVAWEPASLRPPSGELVSYRESYYGRVTLVRDRELLTLFVDGVPVTSGENQILAEEAVHYPLAQLSAVGRVLLISSQAGMIEEIRKYHPREIVYAQLDPVLSDLERAYGLMKDQPGLTVLNGDARTMLSGSTSTFDAILVNYPEPRTFQANRYFTQEFMRLARSRLEPGGVLSFSVEGYEGYLSRPARLRVSSLYRTVSGVFPHVLVLPGQRIWFIASGKDLDADIPGLLRKKGMETLYISGYFTGDVSTGRRAGLMKIMDPAVPANTDLRPHLMRLAHEGWFAVHASRPWVLSLGLALFFLLYAARLTRREYVLFTAGCVNMGSEILTIFLFQILFGYLYVRIGIIVTVYLAGLIPGVLAGMRLAGATRRNLVMTDCLTVLLLLVLTAFLMAGTRNLPEGFFYAFAFLISVLCGLQFSLVAGLQGGTDAAAARAFSADLVGAAFGNVLVSMFLMPVTGIVVSSAALIGIKLTSIMSQIGHGKTHQEVISTL
jgi:spermidine synthase